MNEAEAFVESWSRVWRGADSDPELYMKLLHEGCPLINPISEIRREELPGFMEGRQGIRGHRLLRPSAPPRRTQGRRSMSTASTTTLTELLRRCRLFLRDPGS
jgi:hypothetical protein